MSVQELPDVLQGRVLRVMRTDTDAHAWLMPGFALPGWVRVRMRREADLAVFWPIDVLAVPPTLTSRWRHWSHGHWQWEPAGPRERCTRCWRLN